MAIRHGDFDINNICLSSCLHPLRNVYPGFAQQQQPIKHTLSLHPMQHYTVTTSIRHISIDSKLAHVLLPAAVATALLTLPTCIPTSIQHNWPHPNTLHLLSRALLTFYSLSQGQSALATYLMEELFDACSRLCTRLEITGTNIVCQTTSSLRWYFPENHPTQTTTTYSVQQ